MARLYLETHPNDTVAPAEDSRAVWDRFRDSAGAYTELRRLLAERQQGLCAYCEQRLTDSRGLLLILDQQVEHVKAKSSGPGRALDWENFALCCGGGTYRFHSDPTRFLPSRPSQSNESCGQRKGDLELPHQLDPRRVVGSARFVTVDLEGKLSADAEGCAQVGLDPAEVDELLRFLNLNCERLRTARQKVREHIVGWYAPLLAELLEGTHLDTAEQDQIVNLMMGGRLGPDRHGHLHAFWTTVREALGAPADSWVAVNMERLHFDG